MTQGLLILAVAVIAQAGGPGEPGPMPFTSKEGGFSIAMPGTPSVTVQKADSPAGPIINKAFQVTRVDRVHTVVCSDYPGELKGEDEDALLNGVLQGVSQSTGGRLLSQKKVTIEGRPGREVALKLPLGVLHSRYFLKGKRIYQILQFQMGEKDDPAEFQRFADSFRTVEPVGQLSEGIDALSTWGEFRPKGGGFRVKMIGDPKEQLQKVATPDGIVELHLFYGISNKGETFGVSYHEVPKVDPAPTPEDLYGRGVAGAVENLKGKLLRQNAIEYRGRPATEAEVALPGKMAFPDPTYLVRMYWLKDRLYQVIYIGPKANLKAEEVVSFLDSFRLDGDGPLPAGDGAAGKKPGP